MSSFPRNYRVVRLLHKSEEAEVFEAIATNLDGSAKRRVALKRSCYPIHHDCFDLSFVDEAAIASELEHPNIVRLLDYGVYEDHFCHATEYIDGLDVRCLLELANADNTPMPAPAALVVAAEIGRALQYAHEAQDQTGVMGIVHRDVCPSNILLGLGGSIKLADFGIASAYRRQVRTQVGIAKGTIGYMAPEQAKAGRVDARTDVFGLGCTLHAMLSGTSPFASVSFFELAANTPGVIDPRIDPAIAEIIQRAVDVRPRQRFASAVEFAGACQEQLDAMNGRASVELAKWVRILVARQDEILPSLPQARAASLTGALRNMPVQLTKTTSMLEIEVDATIQLSSVRQFVTTITPTSSVGPEDTEPSWTTAPNQRDFATFAIETPDPVLESNVVSRVSRWRAGSLLGAAVALFGCSAVLFLVLLRPKPSTWVTQPIAVRDARRTPRASPKPQQGIREEIAALSSPKKEAPTRRRSRAPRPGKSRKGQTRPRTARPAGRVEPSPVGDAKKRVTRKLRRMGLSERDVASEGWWKAWRRATRQSSRGVQADLASEAALDALREFNPSDQLIETKLRGVLSLLRGSSQSLDGVFLADHEAKYFALRKLAEVSYRTGARQDLIRSTANLRKSIQRELAKRKKSRLETNTARLGD